MRSEKDVRLRIDLLEGQANAIAKMLAKAMQEHNEEAVKHYSEKLARVKSKVEELLWVLGIKSGQGILASTVTVRGADMTIGDILEKMKSGELKMDDLAATYRRWCARARWKCKTRYDIPRDCSEFKRREGTFIMRTLFFFLTCG